MAAKSKQETYQCSECGWATARWVGRCGECQTWGSVTAKGISPATKVNAVSPSKSAVAIGQIVSEESTRELSGIGELDRVLGGGLVPGAVVLLAGEPGVGKSTLLLDVASKWAKAGRRTLYVTGEESPAQVKLRADRTGAIADELFLAFETDLGAILGHIEQTNPSLLVVDSIQTLSIADGEGIPGGVAQVRETTSTLVRVAKLRSMSVVIIGHVTKDGAIAGPRTLEHLVDVVLNFEGDKHSGFRLVRATKNRFGPADEVGCFEMNDSGIVEIVDPSGLFISRHEEPVPGTCITVTMEGRRPLLSEIQALVVPSAAQTSPRRATQGIDGARLAMVLAVLERKAHLRLSQCDVYVSTVGGVRITDPSADLATAVAIASAAVERNFPKKIISVGEIGLAGDLRRVAGLERRLAEAARLGYELAVVPTNSRDFSKKLPNLHGLKVVEAATLEQALAILDLKRPTK